MAGWVNGGVAESLRFLNHNFCPAACCCLASPPFKLEKAVVIPKGGQDQSAVARIGSRHRRRCAESRREGSQKARPRRRGERGCQTNRGRLIEVSLIAALTAPVSSPTFCARASCLRL